jgi:hypothetical protein
MSIKSNFLSMSFVIGLVYPFFFDKGLGPMTCSRILNSHMQCELPCIKCANNALCKGVKTRSKFDHFKNSFHLFSFFIREVIFHVIILRKKIHIMFSFSKIEFCVQLVGTIVYNFGREKTMFAI